MANTPVDTELLFINRYGFSNQYIRDVKSALSSGWGIDYERTDTIIIDDESFPIIAYSKKDNYRISNEAIMCLFLKNRNKLWLNSYTDNEADLAWCFFKEGIRIAEIEFHFNIGSGIEKVLINYKNGYLMLFNTTNLGLRQCLVEPFYEWVKLLSHLNKLIDAKSGHCDIRILKDARNIDSVSALLRKLSEFEA